MNGPEHYTAAERLLTEAEAIAQQGGDMGAMLTAAHVHATLAQAAATALAEAGANHLSQADYNAWQAVAATASEQGGGDRG
jgi:hypothetical protein